MTIQFKEKFFYASGAVANGVKTDAFTFFLLFFYSNVIGLSPGLASLAIFIALMVDAFTDPLMGVISDRTRHRFGRRHPYFLLGMIPMGLSYFMLFSIQTSWELSQQYLFLWMLTFTMLTRLGMTIFEVPHRSLGSEMSRSYTERTSIFATRELLGWMGGLFNAFLAYTIFFKDTPDYMPGTKNPEPWIYYGMTGATIMCFSVLVTYFGTLKYRDNSQIDITTFNLRLIFNQIFIALKNRSFLIFFFGYLFIAVSWGMGSSLQIYMNTYFWEFKSIMLASYLGIYVLSTISAFLLVPALVKVIEKRTILLFAIMFAALIPPIPIFLFINGFLPASGTWNLFYATIPFVYVGNTCLSSSAIIRESMLGDISDEVELDSKIGQQGLMFASSSLIGKLNTGLGILMAGIALEFISFPQGVEVNPSAENIFNLAMVQGPLVAVLMFIPFGIFSMYKIDRHRHEEIIAKLEQT
ncbi:MAG: MFS transporter [Gammaproteobacteria bacterium]|uniref:MFS transporter n=1 Tax=SAR86 cluster bacterium TaxID=2030880 RepID=A0A368BLH0_9GAMM|nr:MAG: MFS transporter [SAR86 cluster bacterium]|tara:strand:- start:867 stop:2270 length:1404 start_codon:yes stop_codon:yes gene_type:complete